uniref:DNA-directed RNA polymerase n=1 Tax=Watanabea reniformis TaxID=191674 RepID=A0A097KK93_9CHLO|nr:alpha subunit of RNA polymerase [Watanabea reniformis]AIT93603.1 alpha subunit of RNA polymerase [Watanabea reniformis]
MENLVLSCLESRIENNRNLYGRFLLGPFMNGHAITIATALRRALLSEIKGVSITALEIQGTTHEFSTIEGVRESVLDIALNFQQIVLHSEVDLTTPEVGYLQIQGPAVVRAMDLKLPLGIKCVDPTQHIATLSTGGLLVLKFLIARGKKSSFCKKDTRLIKARHIKKAKAFYGEKKDKEFKSEICFRNIIPLDSMFTPVHRVNFLLESDDLSNKPRERLILEVWTNGSIHPRQAIHEAALYLIDLFSIFRKMSHLDSHSSFLPNSRKSKAHRPLPFTEGDGSPPVQSSSLKEPSPSVKGSKARSADPKGKEKKKLLYSALQSTSPPEVVGVRLWRSPKVKGTQGLSFPSNERAEQSLSLALQSQDDTLEGGGKEEENANVLDPKGEGIFEGEGQGLSSSTSLADLNKTSLQQGKLAKLSSPCYKARLMKVLASLYKTNFDKSSFLSLDLTNLSLSLKTYTLLKQNGIHTIDELLKYSSKELLVLLNKDKQMFYDVKNCILRLGLQMS